MASCQSAPSPPPLPVVLRILDAPATPTHFRLAAGVCLIGTSPAAHIVLQEPTVSRKHCEVELAPGGVSVTDLESRNGTYYLDRRIESIVLPPGSTFVVGGVHVSIESDIGRGRVEPSAQRNLGRLSGESLPMRRLFTTIGRLGGSVVPVLIEGESGSGKEACARTLHGLSSAAGGAFVPVRCAALPKDLVAAALFGSRGADVAIGALERADGGTLFLDEIDALPADVQPALLEVIESGELPVATGEVRPAKFRLIASTSIDLEAAVREGRFREGLFFRVAAVRLGLAPLRERREDIPMLALAFAQELGLEGLPPEVIEELRGRSWPGNLRELRSAVQAFAALGAVPSPTRIKGGLLDLALDELVDPTRPYAEQKDELVDRFTRRYLEILLRHTESNQSVAARLAGLDRTYLGRLLSKLGFKA